MDTTRTGSHGFNNYSYQFKEGGLGFTRSYSLTAHQAKDHQGSSTDGPTQASHRAGTRCHGREVRAQGEGSVGGREDPDLGQRIAINGQGQPTDTG